VIRPKIEPSLTFSDSPQERRKAPRNRRLISRGHVADILFDKRSNPHVFHFIVQRIGSAEIAFWGTASTFAEAERDATAYLAEVPYP
jgi:hypothetical protein